MCGRFTLRTPPETIADLFSGIEIPDIPPSYNIAPSQSVAAVRHAGAGGQFAWLKWGLVPAWADDAKIGNRMINARSETVAEKPSFRSAFAKRRCLIPADGFYEWQKQGSQKQPVYIYLDQERPFCFAGLWERNRKTGQNLETCTIITTTPNELLEPIHDRMPAILGTGDYEAWLDPAFEDSDHLLSLLRPWPADDMDFRPVTSQVNKPAFNDPACIEQVASQQSLDF